jgi:hypothetical protein
MAVADRPRLQHVVVALALTLLITGIWSMTHRYLGLWGDAELYAVQALAKLKPALAGDLYLQNASQDRYTVFSWLYARLIDALGLQPAALALYVVCSAWFLAAAWALMRRLSDAGTAWFSVALLAILAGHYGSYGVFRYAEEFLTARSFAEALVVSAVACFFSGARAWALALTAVALSMHPLLALPGLLLLLCLWTGLRTSLAGALLGIGAAALLATALPMMAPVQGPFALIDGAWLAVVRERSQFLFLQLWRPGDWKINALPFASLAVTLLVVPDGRIRQLAWASMLIGAAGLAVALIASTMGPVAILLQGQAWRWMWIPCFAGILLLAPTLLWMWRDPRTGPACALLLAGGWACTAVDTFACLGLAAALWLARPLVAPRAAAMLRGAALALALLLTAWTLANAWTIIGSPSPEAGRESRALAAVRNIMGLQTAALMVFGAGWWWISSRRSPLPVALACLPLAGIAALGLPGALKSFTTAGTPAEISAYADWRGAIAPTANVAVLGVHNAAGFVWFTLERRAYLSIDQSAGVVFSRATALEVRRRSEVLAPLAEPSWKIMTYLARRAADKSAPEPRDKPLTAAALPGLCRDPQLGYLIAHEFVGFDPLRHAGAGPYKDWYLYDCGRVRAAVSAPA